MAISENTRALRGRETLLSKRTFTSNTRPRFHSSSARWAEDSQAPGPLSFDVTWDGPPAPENDYDGYSILVALNQDHIFGDLVLLSDPATDFLALAIAEGKVFKDACSAATIAEEAQVIGQVIGERQYLTTPQLRKQAIASNRVKWAGFRHLMKNLVLTEKIDAAIRAAKDEFEGAALAVAYSPTHDTSHMASTDLDFAMKDSPAYAQVRDEFRQWDTGETFEMAGGMRFNRDVDESLREAFVTMFRAGQYAGPEPEMLDPAPDDYETLNALITSCLDEVDSEDNEGDQFGGLEICTTLIGLPAFEKARDQFRKGDVEDERWPGDQGGSDEDPGDYDFPLRLMLGEWFRAGMLAARKCRPREKKVQENTPEAGAAENQDETTPTPAAEVGGAA